MTIKLPVCPARQLQGLGLRTQVLSLGFRVFEFQDPPCTLN